MITGWRHNDLQKSDKAFREEVQKEFERLYNLDAGSKAFDKAVKDALASLLDPKNPNGFGTNGIPGVNGLNGQGNGRDGIGKDGGQGGDGKSGNGKDGRDGKDLRGSSGGESLTLFDTLNDSAFAYPNLETSGFSILTTVPGSAAGSGLRFESGGKDGKYAPDTANRLGHSKTSNWAEFTNLASSAPFNESRLFTSSYRYNEWTDYTTIAATFPDAFDIDGTLKKPYFFSDIGVDSFGHVQKVKLSNLKNWITGGPDPIVIEPPVDLLEPLRIANIRQTRNSQSYGGLAWYEEVHVDPDDPDSEIIFELNPDIADATEGKYNGSKKRIVGHGETSDWTTGRTGKSYDPTKNHFFSNNHFFRGNWDDPERVIAYEDRSILPPANNYFIIPADDTVALNGAPNPAYNPSLPLDNIDNPKAFHYSPPPFSVITDINADSYGHINFVYTNEMRQLLAGRGLWFNAGDPDHQWYHPAKESLVEHPLRLVGNEFILTPAPALEDYAINVGATPNVSIYGEALRINTGGSTLVPANPAQGIPAYISPKIPTAFWTNDSGHLEAIGWSDLPLIRGPKGDKGDAAIVAAYVAATNTLPDTSPASVSVVNTGNSSNANFAFTFNIPKGRDGVDGLDGDDGSPGAPASVAALIHTVTTGVPNVSVTNWGTTQNAIFAFDFVLPPGGDVIITGDTYYNNNVQNVGSYGFWRDLVQNPGNNNPIYIKRVAAEGGLQTFEAGNTISFTHSSRSWTPDGVVSYDLGGFSWDSGRLYTEPYYDSGFITFPRHVFNSSGHLINVIQGEPIPIGGGGGGSYSWNAATATATSIVNTGNTVRFLSSDIAKLEITQVGRDITFDIKNTAFTLQPLEFGNALSQSPNAAKDPAFKYDPYTGATVHVNNNTRDLAGVVKKGSDPGRTAVVKKAWATDSLDNPDWLNVVNIVGGRHIVIKRVNAATYEISFDENKI